MKYVILLSILFSIFTKNPFICHISIQCIFFILAVKSAFSSKDITPEHSHRSDFCSLEHIVKKSLPLGIIFLFSGFITATLLSLSIPSFNVSFISVFLFGIEISSLYLLLFTFTQILYIKNIPLKNIYNLSVVFSCLPNISLLTSKYTKNASYPIIIVLLLFTSFLFAFILFKYKKEQKKKLR